jgi:putative acetyltransferase
MRLRKYQSADCPVLAQLFYDTVHAINAEDYTQDQLEVWATGRVDLSVWNKTFLEHNTLVAEENGIIVGFGDMDNGGYIDRLFVHKDFQRMGIATAIINTLEFDALKHSIFIFTTHASITAKPFFEKHGYKVLRENTVIREGIALTNFIMVKNCTE